MKAPNLKNSAGWRLILISTISLALLIPSAMVQSLVNERAHRRAGAIAEVSSRWGKVQTVSGPLLTLPYTERLKHQNGTVTEVQHKLTLLPEELSISGEVSPEVRYRGIYEVVLYGSEMRISGRFRLPEPAIAGVPDEQIRWGDARLSLGIADMKGIRRNIVAAWNGADVALEPGTPSRRALASGASASVEVRGEQREYEFSVALSLNGSGSLLFVPVGKETRVELSAPWPDPSFAGSFLPETREVTSEQFTATWEVFHLSRNYPQVWTDEEFNLHGSEFGVQLMVPADGYQKTTRTSKYAFLFIGLTFLALFMTEVMRRQPLHPIQYAMVGAALVLFYVLLLALSEHIGFSAAYLAAALSMIALVGLYTRSILGRAALAAQVCGLMGGWYGFMYVVLHLQDYALLLGSLGLFAVLAAIMGATRNLDWFSVLSGDLKAQKQGVSQPSGA